MNGILSDAVGPDTEVDSIKVLWADAAHEEVFCIGFVDNNDELWAICTEAANNGRKLLKVQTTFDSSDPDDYVNVVSIDGFTDVQSTTWEMVGSNVGDSLLLSAAQGTELESLCAYLVGEKLPYAGL